MFSTTIQMPRTAADFFTIYASFTGVLMLIRSMFNDLIPDPVRSYIESKLHHWFTFKPVPSKLTLIIEKSVGYVGNEVYEAAEIYLRTKIGPDADRLKISKTPRQKNLTVGIEKGQDISDEFNGIQMLWKLVNENEDKETKSGKREYFELQFDKKFKRTVLDSYIPYLLSKSKEIKENERVIKLYTRDHTIYDDEYSRGGWGSINLEHPSNFETLAMDPSVKKNIIEDLDRFVKRREFYKRVGKAWKRGYLLYGPPGTGKSSLIAAMANYLRFDIYDLELASCYSNSDLRGVLLATTNRSIIVIEDIDCNPEVRDREEDEDDRDSSQNDSKITLSGLLNFCDGLWSSCGDERIIIFTTNHKEKLDPALLRPGRMDMHIHMSYSTFAGFKILASNYLQITDHPLFEQIEMQMNPVEITPAEIAEELMKSDDADLVLNALIKRLEEKKNKPVLKDQNKDNDEKEKLGSKKDKSESEITE